MANRAYQRACAPVLLVTTAAAIVARASCGCGVTLDWRLASRKPPPDIIRKHFIQRGWRLDRAALCPTCQEKKPVAIEKTKSITQPIATDAARTAKQLVFLALIDFYDPASRAYKPGHGDATIAKEYGVAAEFVAKIREADFGPIVEPSEVAELRAEIAELGVRLVAAQRRFDVLAQRNGWVA